MFLYVRYKETGGQILYQEHLLTPPRLFLNFNIPAKKKLSVPLPLAEKDKRKTNFKFVIQIPCDNEKRKSKIQIRFLGIIEK